MPHGPLDQDRILFLGHPNGHAPVAESVLVEIRRKTGPLGGPPWLDALPPTIRVALSSHIRPHNHPASAVVDLLARRNITPFRTGEHYHLIFRTEGARDASGGPAVTVEWTQG